MVDTAEAASWDAELRRDAILEAVTFGAECLLLASDWHDAIDEVLARIGVAADASLVYVLESVLDAGGAIHADLVAEWCPPGVSSRLSGHAAGSGADRPEVWTASVPVTVGGEPWGLLGCDGSVRTRGWTRAELDALRAAASVLGAAIERQRRVAPGRATEERYQTFVEHIPAVTYTDVMRDGRAHVGYISPQVEPLLGYPVERFLEDPDFWFSIIHEDDRARVDAAASTITQQEPFDLEYRMLAADGSVVWVHDTSSEVVDADGTVGYWQGFLVDVTDRKQAEDRVRRAEERYRALVEHIPAVVYARPIDADPDGFYLSPQAQHILGYGRDEWADTPGFWADRIHPDDREAVLAMDEETDRTGEPYVAEYRFRVADGSYRWFHDEAVQVRDEDDSPLYWQGVFTDITRRKEAEDQLRGAEERYRALVEHIPAVVYVESAEGDPERFYISPQVEEVFGYPADEWRWTRDFWVNRVHPDDRPLVESVDERANAERGSFSHEYRFLAADRTWRWVHDEATFLAGSDGSGYWQGFILDITERKRVEDQLKEAELKFRTIVEQSQATFYTQEIDPVDPWLANTTYVGPRDPELIGYSLAEIEADPGLWRKIIHPDDRERVLAADAASNTDGSDQFSMEYRMVRKDGQVVWVQDEATLVRIPGKAPYWQGFLLDVTERKLVEQQLARALDAEREVARRLRAVDEMKNTFLQAVSHDLRTPLAAILGLAVTLERGDVHLEENDARDLAGRIAENARKLDRLVVNLLDMDRLARGIVAPKRERIDVGGLARRVAEECDLIDPSRLTIDVERVEIVADPAKIERIIENLLANTARHTPTNAHVWVRVRPSGDGALILVEDSGVGVPAEIRETIFEPFQQGPDAPQHSPGVGVGLTLVRRFAELHGGHAWVEERQGGGASFRVSLPAAPPAVDDAEAPA